MILEVLDIDTPVRTPIGDGAVARVKVAVGDSLDVHYLVVFQASELLNPAFRGRRYTKWFDKSEVTRLGEPQ